MASNNDEKSKKKVGMGVDCLAAVGPTLVFCSCSAQESAEEQALQQQDQAALEWQSTHRTCASSILL